MTYGPSLCVCCCFMRFLLSLPDKLKHALLVHEGCGYATLCCVCCALSLIAFPPHRSRIQPRAARRFAGAPRSARRAAGRGMAAFQSLQPTGGGDESTREGKVLAVSDVGVALDGVRVEPLLQWATPLLAPLWRLWRSDRTTGLPATDAHIIKRI